MRRLETLQDILLAGLAIIGAIATTLLMLHVVADVAMRNLFNRPIPATYEVVVNYYMVAMAFVPLAWIEKTGGMVQVEVINGMLSPGMLRLSDTLVALISVAIYATLAWVTWKVALRTTATGTFVLTNQLRVPVWPAYWLPPLGFGLAALACALRLLPRTKAPQS